MKIYCIADNIDTALGLKLAGSDSVVAESSEEVEKELEKVIQNSEIGILVITKKVYESSKVKIDEIRYKRKLPLITILD